MIDHMREVSERECFNQCCRVVIEFPASFYNPKFSGGALTPVAGISGACMALFQNENKNKVIPAYPSQWNGAKKKATTAKIITDILGQPSEWEFDDNPKNTKDYEHVIDAVGMSYWIIERDYFEKEEE